MRNKKFQHPQRTHQKVACHLRTLLSGFRRFAPMQSRTESLDLELPINTNYASQTGTCCPSAFLASGAVQTMITRVVRKITLACSDARQIRVQAPSAESLNPKPSRGRQLLAAPRLYQVTGVAKRDPRAIPRIGELSPAPQSST
jgi:hypothetical protein